MTVIAELRRLATAEPSEPSWEELIAALEALPAEDAAGAIAAALDELRTRLAIWPLDIPRRLPLRWIFDEPTGGGTRSTLRARPWPRGVALATHLRLDGPVLTSSRGELLRLIEAPELLGLRSLDLGLAYASQRQWRQIASRPTRQALRHLALRGADARLAPLLDGPCFAALAHLDLSDGSLGAPEVFALVRATHLTKLEQLDLARNPIGDAGLAAVADAGVVSGRLERTNLTDAGMTHLARSPHLAALDVLDLSDNRIGAAGIAHLMASRGVENVRALDLRGCAIGPEGAEAIAASPHVHRLRGLGLHGGRIGARGLAALTRAGWFVDVEDLDLAYGELDDEALETLVRLPSSRLRRLDLGSSAITAHGLQRLLASPAGSRLEQLSLHSCVRLGPQGAAALATAPTSASLQILNLQNCNLGAPGARSLAGSPFLSNLRELWIWTGDIQRDGERSAWNIKAALAAALPHTRIIG
jgi:hypothetical protein